MYSYLYVWMHVCEKMDELYICVCINAYGYVSCLYECKFVYMYLCMHVSVNKWMYVLYFRCVYVYVCFYLRINLFLWCILLNVSVYRCVHVVIYVCICCMYERMHVCVVDVCPCACMYYVQMYVRTNVCMYLCVCKYVRMMNVYIYVSFYICINVYMCYIDMYVCVNIYVYICVWVFMYDM